MVSHRVRPPLCPKHYIEKYRQPDKPIIECSVCHQRLEYHCVTCQIYWEKYIWIAEKQVFIKGKIEEWSGKGTKSKNPFKEQTKEIITYLLKEILDQDDDIFIASETESISFDVWFTEFENFIAGCEDFKFQDEEGNFLINNIIKAQRAIELNINIPFLRKPADEKWNAERTIKLRNRLDELNDDFRNLIAGRTEDDSNATDYKRKISFTLLPEKEQKYLKQKKPVIYVQKFLEKTNDVEINLKSVTRVQFVNPELGLEDWAASYQKLITEIADKEKVLQVCFSGEVVVIESKADQRSGISYADFISIRGAFMLKRTREVEI